LCIARLAGGARKRGTSWRHRHGAARVRAGLVAAAHPRLELVGEMKRLRRGAPEPTSAMEPWLQKAVDDKLLI